jgi:hypothetical protein
LPKLTLATVGNIETAATTINANSDLIETALENTLSRDGTSPNSMGASLDMNSQRILNLPAAVADAEPLRKAEFDDAMEDILDIEASLQDLYDDFRTRYLGAQASAPTLDLLGNPLQAGALYFNTTDDTLYVFGTDWNPSSGGGGGGGATNLSVSRNATTVTVASDTGSDAVIPAADGTDAGLMVPAQFTKLSHISVTQAVDLDTIETNSAASKVKTDFITVTQGVDLDAIETLANAAQPGDADLTAIAGLSPSNDDVLQRKAGNWINRTPAQLKTDLALVKGDVGLGNADNTSDADKPISTATQTALDAKQASDPFLDDIAALTDPGADRILFWDDSAGEFVFLTPGTNLSITGTTINASGGAGGGDMDSAIYDPTTVAGDAFDMDNMVEGATNKILTAAERTKVGHISVTQAVNLDTIESDLAAHIGSGGASHADVVAGGADGFMTGADKTKLDGIATGATANATDAQLRDRSTHTGSQAQSTITNLVTDLAALFNSVTRQTFTASGTYTPNAKMLYCIIECWGGGGGGGATTGAASNCRGGGGGQGGGYATSIKTAADIGASKAVTIGAAGTGGSAGNNNGTAGGDTSVGVLVVAKGGAGGNYNNGAASYGAPGNDTTAGTGDHSTPGIRGLRGLTVEAAAGLGQGGDGGHSQWGRGGTGGFAQTNTTAGAGGNATGFAAGGGGAGSRGAANGAGGNGTAGYVIITEFLKA